MFEWIFLIVFFGYVTLMVPQFEGYLPLLKRFPHGSLFSLITLLGSSFQEGLPFTDPTYVIHIATPSLLFWAIYVINAYRDQVEDNLNGRLFSLPPPHFPLQYAWTFFLLVYQGSWHLWVIYGIAEIYHHPLTRGKRFWWFQFGSESLCAALCCSFGGAPFWFSLLVGFGFGVVSNIKDMDDGVGDFLAGNKTLFVLLCQKRGWDQARTIFEWGWLVSLIGLTLLHIALFARLSKTEAYAGISALGLFTLSTLYPAFFWRSSSETKIRFANLGILLSLPITFVYLQ